MFLAEVIGQVVSTKTDEMLVGKKLLLLRPKLVDEALRHGVTVECVVAAEGTAFPEGLPGTVRRVTVPGDVMHSISPLPTPQGVLAMCARVLGDAGPQPLRPDYWRDRIEVDADLVRPTDSADLVGDPGKAERTLGWRRTKTFPEIVAAMVAADLTDMGEDPAP